MEIERIVTHTDFDGVVSAAICSFALGVDRFFFRGPSAVERSEASITARDARTKAKIGAPRRSAP
mgnify:CR=1 FL=1